ncbi:(11Z)-hexadec-11-enoyl-CoA conjugase-like isoform X2 [Zootermopsis nevadensis]|uniref:Acyl-CoA Delta(11) desaturase n=2 Tax=Zootermopsis nevadensis TaxID=136037 RepID=A0A067RHH4_ZOONE|nr:(11Z)-hexadec-11-enoyl-CoA conjugase-like isoform X2 [Zootermopsis nevadensis]KDR18593.1 Acyl-CoA Delta(11) desaturase [Zootermopsis nevadensis]
MDTTVLTTETKGLHHSASHFARGADSQRPKENGIAVHYDGQLRHSIVWRNVVIFLYVHLAALYGIYVGIFQMKALTAIWVLGYGGLGALGITAGAHRLWAHRSYKARWQLRVILGIFQTIAFQNHIYEWARDHRVHHKFSETDADPHNAKRGFFFSHVGWLLVRKHPDVKRKGKLVDMSDLENDFVVVFQRRYYLILMPLMTFIIPTLVPVYLWDEDFWTAWYCTMFRWVASLNFTWLVNSAAHMWGNKPFDESISAVENLSVASIGYGEGWHNYHHVFPWDYKAAELGTYRANLTTGLIDFFSRIGWAYDLKTVSVDMIRRRAARTGDGSRHADAPLEELHETDNGIWGWGDKDMSIEDIKEVQIYNRCD